MSEEVSELAEFRRYTIRRRSSVCEEDVAMSVRFTTLCSRQNSLCEEVVCEVVEPERALSARFTTRSRENSSSERVSE